MSQEHWTSDRISATCCACLEPIEEIVHMDGPLTEDGGGLLYCSDCCPWCNLEHLAVSELLPTDGEQIGMFEETKKDGGYPD